MGSGGVWAALAAIALGALAARALGYASVFPGGGEVVLWLGDAPYHARLALYACENFPAFLSFDPYLDHPRGAVVPWPPAYPWLTAAAARALGSCRDTLEPILAVSPAVLGALTTLPVYAAARALAPPGVGLTAAALYAFLGVSVGASGLGNADHPAAVALVGALSFALSLAALASERQGRPLAVLALATALCRAALVLTWAGSPLLLGLAAGAALLGAILARRRDLLFLEATASAGAALLVAPVVVASAPPPEAAFSILALSWLPVAGLAATATLAGVLWIGEGLAPSPSPAGRGLRTAGAAVLIGGALLALPAVREAVAPSLYFVTARSPFRVAEQTPLFGLGALGTSPVAYFGWFAYAVPLAPLAGLFAAREPRLRLAGFGLAFWTLALGLLTTQQFRFGSEFAAVACVSFALGTHQLVEAGLSRIGRSRAAAVLAPGLALLALVPCFAALHAPRLAATRAAGESTRGDPLLATEAGTFARFARAVRAATPETRSFLADEGPPEYGVLSSPNLGHAIRYLARRPTTVGGFFEYLDPLAFAQALRFFATESPAEALAIADRLRSRYALTWHDPDAPRRSLLGRLHGADAIALEGGPEWGSFRLVTEGPRGGRPLLAMVGRARGSDGGPIVPYKLFELVPGARLEVIAAPGAPVDASLALETPLPRRFAWRARAVADGDGVARLRLPYPTHGDEVAPVRATGPYRVAVDGRAHALRVAAHAVQRGDTLVLDVREGSRGPDDAATGVD